MMFDCCVRLTIFVLTQSEASSPPVCTKKPLFTEESGVTTNKDLQALTKLEIFEVWFCTVARDDWLTLIFKMLLPCFSCV